MTTRASAFAPETARSFTVPFTASSPIDPPGKRSGFTTKLSVVIAMRVPLIVEMGRIAQRFRDAAKKQRRKEPFHQPAAGLAAGPVRHLDLRIAEADLGAQRPCSRLRRQAADAMLVTIAVLRCS